MDLLAELEIRTFLPRLESGRFSITSPKSAYYNCIAWAAEDTTRWWWPDGQNYWPNEIPRKRNLDAFVQLFQSLGYEICEKADLEEDFKKVALFVGAAGIPTHAARQQDDGSWTSKLGTHHDISHEL